MVQRINVWKIIHDHFKTLRSLNQPYNFINIGDFFLFLLIPAILSIALTANGYSFTSQLGNLITCISIFGGFLFNLLAIIYSQLDKIKADISSSPNPNPIKARFLKELHVNISFCILLSVTLLMSLLSTTVDLPCFKFSTMLSKSLIFINYFLMILFLLTLLMVINRVYILLKRND